MMFLRSIFSACLVALLVLGATADSVRAGFIHNSTGLASGMTISAVTFGEETLADLDVVTTQFASQGVGFLPYPAGFPPLYDNDISDKTTAPNISGEAVYLPGLGDLGIPTVFVVKFTDTLTEAAFAMSTKKTSGFGSPQAQKNKFEALLWNSVTGMYDVQETASVTSLVDPMDPMKQENRSDNFYGFTGITFDAIRVSVATASSGDAIIDNIQLGQSYSGGAAVPEPATAVIWMALASVGFLANRRRRKN